MKKNLHGIQFRWTGEKRAREVVGRRFSTRPFRQTRNLSDSKYFGFYSDVLSFAPPTSHCRRHNVERKKNPRK